jgi:hypothetical protein
VSILLNNNEFIPLHLMIKSGNVELIASNYPQFKMFEEAIEEVIKKKKNLYGLLKFLENI